METTARARNNGTKNLIPVNKRTKEEQKQITSMGGKASAQARRQRKETRALAKFVLDLIPELPTDTRKALGKMGLSKEEKPSIHLISMLAIAQKSMKGDLQANKWLEELAGNTDPRTELEREKLALEVARFEYEKKLRGEADEYNGDGGFLEALNGVRPEARDIADVPHGLSDSAKPEEDLP